MTTMQLSQHRLDQNIMSASCRLLTKTCLNLAAQCFLITRSVTVKFACLDVLVMILSGITNINCEEYFD